MKLPILILIFLIIIQNNKVNKFIQNNSLYIICSILFFGIICRYIKTEGVDNDEEKDKDQDPPGKTQLPKQPGLPTLPTLPTLTKPPKKPGKPVPPQKKKFDDGDVQREGYWWDGIPKDFDKDKDNSFFKFLSLLFIPQEKRVTYKCKINKNSEKYNNCNGFKSPNKIDQCYYEGWIPFADGYCEVDKSTETENNDQIDAHINAGSHIQTNGNLSGSGEKISGASAHAGAEAEVDMNPQGEVDANANAHANANAYSNSSVEIDTDSHGDLDVDMREAGPAETDLTQQYNDFIKDDCHEEPLPEDGVSDFVKMPDNLIPTFLNTCGPLMDVPNYSSKASNCKGDGKEMCNCPEGTEPSYHHDFDNPEKGGYGKFRCIELD